MMVDDMGADNQTPTSASTSSSHAPRSASSKKPSSFREFSPPLLSSPSKREERECHMKYDSSTTSGRNTSLYRRRLDTHLSSCRSNHTEEEDLDSMVLAMPFVDEDSIENDPDEEFLLVSPQRLHNPSALLPRRMLPRRRGRSRIRQEISTDRSIDREIHEVQDLSGILPMPKRILGMKGSFNS